MRFLWASIEKDLRRRMRDPLALVLGLGIPLLIGGLLLLVMGGTGGAPPSMLVYLADEDGGTLADLLSLAFGSAGGTVRLEQTTREEARQRLAAGQGTALVVIPRGFARAVLAEEPIDLLLVVNPSQTILPEIVAEALELISEAAFYAHRLLGQQIREIAHGGANGQNALEAAHVARVAAAIHERVTQVEKYLFPPAITLETKVDAAPAGRQLGLAALMLPGILVMSLLFTAQSLSDDVWSERKFGTLKRMVGTPSSLGQFLAGKVLAATCLLGAIAVAVLAAGMPAVGVPWRALPAAAAWTAASGSLFYLVLLLVQLHASSQRAAGILLSSVLIPLMFLGGSFFPSEAMPEWMAAVGRFTPNGWALEHLKDLLLERARGPSLLAGFCGQFVAGIAAFLLARRQLLRRFARG